MANQFSKEEIVAFDQVMEGFEDATVLSKNVSRYQTDGTSMERSGDVIWRPQPYILNSYDGMDASANFQDATQLTVPATLGYSKHVPLMLDAKQLRDALQEGRLGESAMQRLSSDVNAALMSVAALQGTLVVKRTTAAAGYDDIAQCDTIMNEQGIPMGDRYQALSSRDYNGMANNLSAASRSFGNNKSDKAYENGYVGRVSGFETYKLDYATRLAAAAGGAGLTMDTRDSAVNYYTPVATRVATTGERSNVDNRYESVTISSTTNVAAGDCFTVAGINAVHHITKADTGQLKTFRVISVDSSTTMTISPPMITAQGGTDAELQYQNCVVNTKASNSAIVFLNTTAAAANPFWHKDALEILPGRYAVPSNAGAAVLRSSTSNGIEVVMTKWYDGDTMKTKFRWDTLFGVVNKQPEMSGIVLFGQS